MSQSSDEDNFDAYREDIRSINDTDKERSNDKPKTKKIKLKRSSDFNTRLKVLNKALRGKLKDLNDRLERVLDKIYVKSLNPNKTNEAEVDTSHLIRVADKELENAKLQYDQCKIRKQKLQKEYKEYNNASAVIDLEEQIKQLTEKKKELSKEIVDLKYVSLSQGKQLEKFSTEAEDPNEADNLIYKIKALKQKREGMEAEMEKHKNVMEGLKSKIEESKKKVDNERKQVEAAEKKQAEANDRKAQERSNGKANDRYNQEDFDPTYDEEEAHKLQKALTSMKKETKDKKLELEKLFIVLHERDKENRLLNLKIKEIERIVPQARLNPMSREKMSGIARRRRKMKNSSINDANKSVLVTKKEQRLKQIRGRNKSPNARSLSKVNELENRRDSPARKPPVHDVPKVKPSKERDDSEDNPLSQNDGYDNVNHIPKEVKLLEKEGIIPKKNQEPKPAMGKGLNGEPSIVKPAKELEKVQPPMKLNPETFKTEVDIKQK